MAAKSRPRGILHTGSRDSAVGHEGLRKVGETDGGAEGTRGKSNDGTEQVIKASRGTTGG
mgnify:CR=1 FL=1